MKRRLYLVKRPADDLSTCRNTGQPHVFGTQGQGFIAVDDLCRGCGERYDALAMHFGESDPSLSPQHAETEANP